MQIETEHPVIIRLAELQGTQSDRAFAKRWLTISETTWFRVKAGSYSASDHTRVIDKLSADLARLEDHLVIAAGADPEVLPMQHIALGLAATRCAFGQPRNRLVIILGETGGGKTSVAQAIHEEFPGACAGVQASEPWRTSYMAALQSIADAAGIGRLPQSARIAENQLIAYLTKNPRLIVIDEGNYFGPATLNLVKLILNVTKSTVVILALPEFWERLVCAHRQEAQQLRNRTAAKVTLSTVDAAGVRVLMHAHLNSQWSSMDTTEITAATAKIVREGNTFGLWNTVVSIGKEIKAEAGDGPLDPKIIDKAISNVRALRN
jgi:hypothetical protein